MVTYNIICDARKNSQGTRVNFDVALDLFYGLFRKYQKQPERIYSMCPNYFMFWPGLILWKREEEKNTFIFHL